MPGTGHDIRPISSKNCPANATAEAPSTGAMSDELPSAPMVASIGGGTLDGDACEARPEKRQRKQRPCYSCEGKR